ncbi:MAG: hypothetical protein CR993_08520 [Rhodobacterales bacterium]|nr:MAG: hypothetical protein CR993_08520 [Rhodobacterales bacterium]
MSDKIWVSTFLNTPSAHFYYSYPEDQIPHERAMQIAFSILAGRKVDTSGLPHTKVAFDAASAKRKLRKLLSIDGLHVDETAKQVMEQFNLGDTFLHRVELFDETGKVKKHDGYYYHVITREQRQVVNRELGLEKGWIRPGVLERADVEGRIIGTQEELQAQDAEVFHVAGFLGGFLRTQIAVFL